MRCFRGCRYWCVVLFLSMLLPSMTDHFVSAQDAPLDANIPAAWSFDREPGKLILKEAGRRIAVFHYQDDRCFRPFFSQVCTVTGKQVTRNYPPIPGVDPDDHATMHGGIWLGFGDINGEDFWRNKSRIQHKKFIVEPSVNAQGIHFACQDELIDSKGDSIGWIEQDYRVSRIGLGYCLVWIATFQSGSTPLVLGDQEEMGLGVRVATGMTEKNGGRITSSTGSSSAKETWGKTADWVDYSKTEGGRRLGVLLMPDSENFQPSWFHNRDYGLMVANCFGRKSFTQGAPSQVVIQPGQRLTLRYRTYWYECGSDDQLPIEGVKRKR